MKRYARALGKYRCRRSHSIPRKVVERTMRRLWRRAVDIAFERLKEKLLAVLPAPTGWPRFQVGDVVTRAGDDRQRVLSVTEDGFCIDVECIEAPASAWCSVGDREHNLARRYAIVEMER